MKYTMQDKKDNKIYKVKSLDEIALKDGDDLFVVKLDGSKLHTYDEFVATAKAAFQTPTDESMFWLHTPSNPLLCWINDLEWLIDKFERFVLIIEHWDKALDKETADKKQKIMQSYLQDVCNFWGYEILNIRGNGYLETEYKINKPREFNIYLVE